MSEQQTRLQDIILDIEQRTGERVMRAAAMRSSVDQLNSIPTGFAVLDAALNLGGLPRQHLTDLSGGLTSGMTTLAHRVIANAQAQDGSAAYIDLSGTFDPDYAQRCGVNLDRLLIVRPRDAAQSLAIARDLCKDGDFRVIALDFALMKRGSAVTRDVSRRLAAALNRSDSALLLLRPAEDGQRWGAFDTITRVRLSLVRETWLCHGSDVNGYRVRVTICKDQSGVVERSVSIDITFDQVVKGDGT